jgi:hypothetical protein
MDGIHGAPVGFPNHCEFQILILPKQHFRQYIIYRFGMQFLTLVENSPSPIFLPVIVYAHRWIICFYILT